MWHLFLVRLQGRGGKASAQRRRRRPGRATGPGGGAPAAAGGGCEARHITLLISLIHTIVQTRCFILYFHTLVLVDTPTVTVVIYIKRTKYWVEVYYIHTLDEHRKLSFV